MQAAQSSRPASGAEHQFSHLWDMQHHTHNGTAPSHGFKVGIGTLASLALYEVLLRRDLERLDVDDAVATLAVVCSMPKIASSPCLVPANWPPRHWRRPGRSTRIADALRAQLVRLRDGWPTVRERLTTHLLPFRNARGCFERRAARLSRNRSGYPAIAFGCRTSKPTSSGGGLRR